MEEQNQKKLSEIYYRYIQKFYSMNGSILFTKDNIDKSIFVVSLILIKENYRELYDIRENITDKE